MHACLFLLLFLASAAAWRFPDTTALISPQGCNAKLHMGMGIRVNATHLEGSAHPSAPKSNPDPTTADVCCKRCGETAGCDAWELNMFKETCYLFKLGQRPANDNAVMKFRENHVTGFMQKEQECEAKIHKDMDNTSPVEHVAGSAWKTATNPNFTPTDEKGCCSRCGSQSDCELWVLMPSKGFCFLMRYQGGKQFEMKARKDRVLGIMPEDEDDETAQMMELAKRKAAKAANATMGVSDADNIDPATLNSTQPEATPPPTDNLTLPKDANASILPRNLSRQFNASTEHRTSVPPPDVRVKTFTTDFSKPGQDYIELASHWGLRVGAALILNVGYPNEERAIILEVGDQLVFLKDTMVQPHSSGELVIQMPPNWREDRERKQIEEDGNQDASERERIKQNLISVLCFVAGMCTSVCCGRLILFLLHSGFDVGLLHHHARKEFSKHGATYIWVEKRLVAMGLVESSVVEES